MCVRKRQNDGRGCFFLWSRSSVRFCRLRSGLHMDDGQKWHIYMCERENDFLLPQYFELPSMFPWKIWWRLPSELQYLLQTYMFSQRSCCRLVTGDWAGLPRMWRIQFLHFVCNRRVSLPTLVELCWVPRYLVTLSNLSVPLSCFVGQHFSCSVKCLLFVFRTTVRFFGV